MGLIVETGAGLAAAESYVSVPAFKMYMIRRGLAAPTDATDADLEGALVRASEAIDAIYGTSWQGLRASGSQALDWPRAGVYLDGRLLDSGSLPRVLTSAVCEAAWREAAAPGSLVPDVDSSGRVVSETVGPLSVTYAAPTESESSGAPSVTFTSIDKLLSRLTTGGGVGGSSVYAYLLRA